MDLDHLKNLVDACHKEADETNDTIVSGAALDAYLLTVEPAASIARDRERTALKLDIAIAERDLAQANRATCNGSCDIALARRQVGPDGVVPGNARECAELWEREAARLAAECNGRRYDPDLVSENKRLNGEIVMHLASLEAAHAERDEVRADLEGAIRDLEATNRVIGDAHRALDVARIERGDELGIDLGYTEGSYPDVRVRALAAERDQDRAENVRLRADSKQIDDALLVMQAKLDAFEIENTRLLKGAREAIELAMSRMSPETYSALQEEIDRLKNERDGFANEVVRLDALINTPRTDDFFEAVRIEAAHQVERWGVEHDAGKRPEDWIALFIYLLGKATKAHYEGNRPKLEHHVITAAAVALNWHRYMTGVSTLMRPGVAPREVSP